jgi:c(7)-type cytochrome triheme protein
MHSIRFGSVALGVVVILLTVAPGGAQQKLPDPFQFPPGKDSLGPVMFDHSKHKAAGVDKCTACHVKLFKMKKGQTGPLTMDKMKAGEQCGACHDGHTKVGATTVFTVAENCEKCHK